MNIGCGNSHSVFIDDEGNLWGVGSNSSGQLGLKLRRTVKTFCKIGLNDITQTVCVGSHSIALRNDGIVYGFGSNKSGQLSGGGDDIVVKPERVFGVHDVTMVATGCSHLILLDTSGVVWGCGDNFKGQLGLNVKPSRIYTPTQIEKFSTGAASIVTNIFAFADRSFLIDESEELFAFGSNDDGALGIKSKKNRAILPTKVKGIKEVISVGSSSNNNTIILNGSGEVWNCGRMWLQIGHPKPRSKPERLELSFTPKTVAVAESCCAFVDVEGGLWIFGTVDAYRGNEQFHKGTKLDIDAHFVSVVGTWNHFFACTIDNEVYGFGSNASGQIIPTGECIIFPPEKVSLPFKLKSHDEKLLIKSARK